MNSRFTKGLIYGGLIGAAIGAYWMLRTDGAAKLMLEKQGRRARQMARRRTVTLRDGVRRAGSAWQSGKGAVKAGWHALRS
ncbi:MAG: hypothetical protein GX322_03175 [Firmicutes bacterium]|nr:hypothetical protein [Bacillota bacterium]